MRTIEVYMQPGYDVSARFPDTPSGRREARRMLGVARLTWHDASDDNGLIAVAVQPGADPADARPMACLVEERS